MPRLSSELLRTALALKLSQIKRATRSYLRDRTNQATGTVASYAIAVAFFAVSGVFSYRPVLWEPQRCFVGLK